MTVPPSTNYRPIGGVVCRRADVFILSYVNSWNPVAWGRTNVLTHQRVCMHGEYTFSAHAQWAMCKPRPPMCQWSSKTTAWLYKLWVRARCRVMKLYRLFVITVINVCCTCAYLHELTIVFLVVCM